MTELWSQLEERLGPEPARAAAERGRRLAFTDVVAAALAEVDARRARAGA